MKQKISLNVALSNPGQVFACCGLFECVYALDGEAPMAWFARVGKLNTTFHLESSLSLNDLLAEVRQNGIENNIAEEHHVKEDNKNGPISILAGKVIIDWRKTYPYSTGKHSVKTWAGRQGISKFMDEGINKLPEKANQDLLDFKSDLPVASPGFDTSRAEGALDTGFPLDDYRGSVYHQQFAIVTEIFSLIGLQRFCPRKMENSLYYNIWFEPLSILAASAIFADDTPCADFQTYSFEIFNRTRDKKYKSLNYARSKHESNFLGREI